MHRDRHRLLLVTSLIAAATAVTLVACKSGPRRQPAPPAQPPISHSAPFHRLPPAVEDATIERLAAPNNDGNALLEVKFEAGDPRTAKGVSIFPEGKEVRLMDNGAGADRAAGDGVFSSFVQFDFAEAARARDAEMKRLSGQREPRNIFRNRHIIGVENTKAALERFRKFPAGADIPVGLKFPLGIFGSVVSPSSIDPARSLVITDESVIEDPNRTFSICPSHRASSGGNPDGVWTFKHLMTEMANTPVTGIDPADFTEQWLSLWLTNQVPPTPPAHFAAPARGQMLSRVLLNWPRAGGKLDLNRAPFRLVAIVNRIDLADNPSYSGGSQSAGEGRFVFGVYDMSTATPCDMLPFSIIFEYGVRANGCSGLKNWAQQWVALSSHALGTPAYNNALEAITQQFVSANAAPSKPNGSALNQLRTNENGLNILWELREFRINASTHRLFEDTTAQTIDETLNGSTRLRNYVNSNEIDILNDAHDVPDLFPTATGGTAPFKSTHSLANNPPTTLPSQLSTIFAASGITNNLARHHFSLNTCTGCHIRETNTRFLHIDPTTTPITLSRFMTGATSSISDTPDPFNVTDPVVSSTTHAFNDIDRRRQKLAAIAGSSCFRFILVPPRLRDLKFRIPLDGPLPEIDPIGPIADDFFDPVRMPH